MNRSFYFNYIEKQLAVLAYRVKQRGKLNVLDFNTYCENFFVDLLNLVFSWDFKNMNTIKQNVEGIDLIDHTNKLFAQVSSTSTKQKIQGSLDKEIYLKYPEYRFKFIPIVQEVGNLKQKNFVNPYNVLFTPTEDIIDIDAILKVILTLPIEKQKELYELIKAELGEEVSIVKMDSNLAAIINILAAENLANTMEAPEINSFEIEKKITFNELNSVRWIIDDYKVYYGKVDEKYRQFDREGANKSFAVLQMIRKQYIMLRQEETVPDKIFLGITEKVIDIIVNSKNYVEISYEELEMCVSILVVDAFIRCKIFENPEGYKYVTTR